jgi:hypothetical protein
MVDIIEQEGSFLLIPAGPVLPSLKGGMAEFIQ